MTELEDAPETLSPLGIIDHADAWRGLVRKDFASFVMEFWDTVPGCAPLVWNWHMQVICDALQRAAERVFLGLPKLEDLIFNVPPGTSKSTLCSILFPAWIWTRMPHARIITASHTSDLVLDLSSRSRGVLLSDKYREFFPEIEFVEDQDSKGHFRNTLGGERVCCTVSGKSPIGLHAHFHIVDDPIDPKKARSEAHKQTARQFFTEVLPGRKVDKEVTVLFLIMQRLGIGDPTDVVMQTSRVENAAPVAHYCMPAELSDNVSPPRLKAFYEENGNLLDPHRLPRRVLDRERATMGEYAYAGQMLQKPTPPGGGMFKCLAAGTVVSVLGGDKPIEEVSPGDMVLTRQGYRRVLRSGCTGHPTELLSTEFSDGSVVISTKNHKIWNVARGFVEADSLTVGDQVVSSRDVLCSLYQAGCRKNEQRGVCVPAAVVGPSSFDHITGSGAHPASYTGIMSVDQASSGPSSRGSFTIRARRGTSSGPGIPYIGPFGGTTGGRSRRGLTSITRTGTRGTTTSATSNACLSPPTVGNIGGGCGRGDIMNSLPLPPPGSAVIQRRAGKSSRIVGAFVSSVESSLRRGAVGLFVSAQVVVRAENPVPVYDLEVEGAHEFFANGVLVHNSTHFTQFVKSAPYKAKRIRYWDRAATQGGGCATAGVLIAHDGVGFYVEDVVTGHWEPDERNRMILATAQKDRRRYGRYQPKIYVEREGGSSGVDSFKGIARLLAGFPVREDAVTGSKDVRAEPWSAQLAAMNVYIVDNGESEGTGTADWDVQGYIDEHLNFRPMPGKRIGGLCDRVDASTGAFNLLVGKHAPGTLPLRKITLRPRKEGQPVKILALTGPEVASTVIDVPALLVWLCDPTPPDTEPPKKEHGLNRVVARVDLEFLDVDPEEMGHGWTQPCEGYGGALPETLCCLKEHGRKMWSVLLKRHDPPPEVVVFACPDEGDRRALSAAYAFADALRYRRSEALLSADGSDNKGEGTPPNNHVYTILKNARSTVA